MSMEDCVVYFYLVKQIDYIRTTEVYETLYNDVLKYLPQLNEDSQQHLCNSIKRELNGCENPWAKKLLEYIKERNEPR